MLRSPSYKWRSWFSSLAWPKSHWWLVAQLKWTTDSPTICGFTYYSASSAHATIGCIWNSFIKTLQGQLHNKFHSFWPLLTLSSMSGHQTILTMSYNSLPFPTVVLLQAMFHTAASRASLTNSSDTNSLLVHICHLASNHSWNCTQRACQALAHTALPKSSPAGVCALPSQLLH